jgi:hypothetical protein
MRLLFIAAFLAIGLLGCERTPAPAAAPEQPCACAAGQQGNHTPSGRTQITR